jgi:hypothetical protein
MNNYKELSFLISSLFVIYFFKDIITTLIILVILSSISLLLMKTESNDLQYTEIPNYQKPMFNRVENKPQISNKPELKPKLVTKNK